MSAADWIAALDPAPPADLAKSMRAALPESTSTPSAEDLLKAAEQLLERVLRSDCESRASALDLLTVDALMTHALLVASNDPSSTDDFAQRALARVTAAWQ